MEWWSSESSHQKISIRRTAVNTKIKTFCYMQIVKWWKIESTFGVLLAATKLFSAVVWSAADVVGQLAAAAAAAVSGS